MRRKETCEIECPWVITVVDLCFPGLLTARHAINFPSKSLYCTYCTWFKCLSTPAVGYSSALSIETNSLVGCHQLLHRRIPRSAFTDRIKHSMD